MARVVLADLIAAAVTQPIQDAVEAAVSGLDVTQKVDRSGDVMTGALEVPGLIAKPAAGMSNITQIRWLGVMNHTGAPVALDGSFLGGDGVIDAAGQAWVCTSAGNPGLWAAVGSGRVLGSVRSTSLFTMTTAATPEDVPTMTVSFTFDGRPINFRTTPVVTSQDQAAAKIITLSILRTTDNAVVASTPRQTDATANSTVAQTVESGPLTAWPSDAVPFVVGTTYSVKLRVTSGSSSKASLNGNNFPYQMYVITC